MHEVWLLISLPWFYLCIVEDKPVDQYFDFTQHEGRWSAI